MTTINGRRTSASLATPPPAHDPPRPVERPRRLRRTPALRRLVRETTLCPQQLVLPLFVVDDNRLAGPIESMPGCRRLTIPEAADVAVEAMELGLGAFALFPAVADEHKRPDGAHALDPENIAARALRVLRAAVPEACLIADVALDPYSSLGHDGLIDEHGQVANDPTVDVLAAMAVVLARAGADVIAPSDMMDGRVGAIRTALDGHELQDTVILSYAVKYASAFYGPFRDALDSAPVNAPGVPADKATYQMDVANAREALREARLDEAEGADMLMVKPASMYLDVITRLRAATELPIAAYQVSGTYAMIQAAAERGWIDGRRAMTESLLAIRRAGADVIFTYAAADYARWHRDGDL